MKELAFLEYMFMLDPAGPWQHLSEFESDLRKFFIANGLEAEIVRTVGGQQGKRILFLKKKKMIDIPFEKKGAGRPQSIGRRMKDMKTKVMKAPERNWKNKKKRRKEKGFGRVRRKAGG